MNPRLAALALAGFLLFALSQAWRSGGNVPPEESLDSVAGFQLTTNRYAKRERRADLWRWPVASHTDPSLAGDKNRTTGATKQANAVTVLRTNATSRIANELVVTLPAGAKIQDLLNVLGGDVELVGVDEDKTVRVRLQGACRGCPGATMTMKMGIERILKERVPEVKQVVAVA